MRKVEDARFAKTRSVNQYYKERRVERLRRSELEGEVREEELDNVYVAQRRRDRDQRTATDAGVRAYLELVLADVEGGKKAEGHFGLSNGEWPATATGRVISFFGTYRCNL